MNSSSEPPDGILIPLHALSTLPGERIVRKPGRPKKVRLAPSASEIEYQAETKKLREEALASDPILAARSSSDTIRNVIEQLAREAASLGWEREQAQNRGLESAAQLSSRRVDALGKIANLVVDAHKLGVFGNDPSPTKLEVILHYWMETISAITHEVLPCEAATTFMDRYRAAIGGIDLAMIMNE